MPSFPQPGSVTICEINRELITAESLSDDQAKETYGKVLGIVFRPIPFGTDHLLLSDQSVEQQSEDRTENSGWLASLPAALPKSFKYLFQSNDVQLLPHVDLHGICWHQHKHILAFISGPNDITVCDYEDSEGKDPCILTSESQRGVKLIQWRPNEGRTLTVACKGGICIWTASYPGNIASIRSGVSSGTLSRSTGTRWTLVDFLRSRDEEQISALSWSPNGRYLASGSYESSSFTIWDVAQGLGTPIRRGLGGISVLKWSPSGDYFFSAKFDGTFYLWETNTWTSQPWSSTSGFVKGGTWDPDGRMILITFSESSSLGAIHFSSKPPMLDAHLLPVDLPDIKTLTNSIEKIAWDASGERLAVSYNDVNGIYKGLISVYDVKRAPFISASLIGFIRGPGDNPKPITFSFHDKFKQGPLLSVCWSSGFCCTYPLLFRSHALP